MIIKSTESLKENLSRIIGEKLTIVENIDNGFMVLNPEKVVYIEAKELEK